MGLNLSPSSSSNQDLAASSLKASNYFDEKIEHLENYSNIIENATLNMDACVNMMTTVYQNFEKAYDESPASYLLNDESGSANLNSSRLDEQSENSPIKELEKTEYVSVYDMYDKNETEKEEAPTAVIKSVSEDPVNESQAETGSIKSSFTDSVFNDQVSQKSIFSEFSTEKNDENNSFLTSTESTSSELKLEIK